MENKLRAYMDHLFQDVPNTKKAVEVKRRNFAKYCGQIPRPCGRGKIRGSRLQHCHCKHW